MSAPPGLTSTLRRGAAISGVALVGVQVLSLVQTLVLARLLSPAEIGVFAAGTAVTAFLFVVSEGGLRSALIQRDEAGLEVAANTALWASLAGGVGTGLLALAAAPLIGLIVGDPRAAAIGLASAGAPVLQSLTAVPDALLQRRFAFRRRMITDPSVALAFLVPSVVLAALGAGPWSMVAGLYASNLAFLVTTWALAGWRPGAARPSLRTWRGLARFSLPLLVSGVGERARTMIEALLVGSWLGTTPLALYRYGRRVAELPGRAVVEVGDYVLFPAFARIAGEPDRFRAAFLRATGLVWFAAVPLAGLLWAIGTPVVVVLFGPRWSGAGVVLETMAGWGPGLALTCLGTAALKGAGHTRPVHRLTASGLVLGLGLLAVGIPWLGLAGVGLAVSAERLVTGALALSAARRTLGIRRTAIARALAAPLLAGAVATLAVGVADRELVRGAGVPALLLAEALVFVLLYLGVLRVAAPGTLRAARSVLGRGDDDGVPRLVWVSTGQPGGIAAYVTTMTATGLGFRHLASHVEGSAARRALAFARCTAALLGLLARRRVDVVHLHTASRGSFARKALLLHVAAGARAATVLHVHGGGFADWYATRPRAVRALIRATLHRADAVVALSEGWAARLATIAPAARIVVVANPAPQAPTTATPVPARHGCTDTAPAPPNRVRTTRDDDVGVDPPHPCPHDTKREHDAPRVVCAGRMSAAKGTADLLDAWAGLDGPARLVVVGDGAVDEARRRAAEPDLAGRVEVRDRRPREEVAALLAASDVLVLPSWAEGQPMVVLEAMAAGLPVVATAVGGVPELVEDTVTGLLVPPRDVAALRAGIARLLADAPARARMGAAGRERVRERHDPARIADRLVALYDDVLARRASATRRLPRRPGARRADPPPPDPGPGARDLAGAGERGGAGRSRRSTSADGAAERDVSSSTDAATSHSARSPADTAPPGVDAPERSAARDRIAR